MFLVTILLTLILCNNLVTAGICTISTLRDLKDPQPLLLKNHKSNEPIEAFHLPDDNGDIKITNVLHIVCPGGTIKHKNEDLEISSADLTCTAGKMFALNNVIPNVDISKITCTEPARKVARYTGQSCLGTYRAAEIGFQLDDGHFIKHIEVCYDDTKLTTLYSYYVLTANIGGYQRGSERPTNFETDLFETDLFAVDIATLYPKKTQSQRINSQVGLPAGSTKYVQKNKYYLARGHLTAKVDFVYGSQQLLTFYYLNAVPQWQNNNCGTWSTMERNVRNYASAKKLNLEVYTGTQGVLTLPHEQTGNDVEIYLYEANGVKAVPVPRLLWKVVYDPSTQAGVAFITVNNPYIQEDPICTNICDQLSTWVTFSQNCGSYCCRVAEFRSNNKIQITNMPEITVAKLLL